MFKKALLTLIVTALLLCSLSCVSHASYTLSVWGDIDGDGTMSTTDYLKVKKFFLNQTALTEAEFFKADVDGDRNITTTDYLSIKKIFLEDNELKAVRLYVRDEQEYSLIPVTSYFDGSIESLISQLEKVGAVPEGTEVYSFSIENKTAYIDLSEEFGMALETGTLEEMFVSSSLVNTIICCYGVENVFFTVEGEICTTGHASFDSPLRFGAMTIMYLPDEERMYFEEHESNFDGTAQGLLRAISYSCSVFPKDVEVYSFSIENKTASIDLSEEFGRGLATGTFDEATIVALLVNNIISYYNVQKVQFTVDGEFFDSGHVLYDFPLIFSNEIY